jgi:hypothetical protein
LFQNGKIKIVFAKKYRKRAAGTDSAQAQKLAQLT